jgi:hypothetical protein
MLIQRLATIHAQNTIEQHIRVTHIDTATNILIAFLAQYLLVQLLQRETYGRRAQSPR